MISAGEQHETIREEWRQVPGVDDRYEVSNIGQVRSYAAKGRCGGRRRETSVLLKPSVNGGGYLTVSVGGKQHSVHSLVLRAFVGPRPPGMFGCHGDGHCQNNMVTNLRWDTPQANADDARHGVSDAIREKMKAIPRTRGKDCPESKRKAPMVSLRLAPDVIDALDAFAKLHDLSRSGAVARLAMQY